MYVTYIEETLLLELVWTNELKGFFWWAIMFL